MSPPASTLTVLMNKWGAKVDEALGRVQASTYSLIGIWGRLGVTSVGFKAEL